MERVRVNEVDCEAPRRPSLRLELSHLGRKPSDDDLDDLFSREPRTPKRVGVILLDPPYPSWKDTLCGLHRATFKKGTKLVLMWSSTELLDRVWGMSDDYLNIVLHENGGDSICDGGFCIESKDHLEFLKTKCQLLALDCVVLIGAMSTVETAKSLLQNFIEDISVGVIWIPSVIIRDPECDKSNNPSIANDTYEFYSGFVRDLCHYSLNAREFAFFLENKLLEGQYQKLDCAVEARSEMVLSMPSKRWDITGVGRKICNTVKERRIRGSNDKLIVLHREFIKAIPDLYGLLLEMNLIYKMGVDKEKGLTLLSKESSVLFKALPFFLKKEILEFRGSTHTTQEIFEKLLSVQVDSIINAEEGHGRLYTSNFQFGFPPFSHAIGSISGQIVNCGRINRAVTTIAASHEWRCGSSEFMYDHGERKVAKLRINVVKDGAPKQKEIKVGPFKMSPKEFRDLVVTILLSSGPALASPFIEYLNQQRKDIMEAIDSLNLSQFDPFEHGFF